MIRASERTSDLDQALERFVAYSEQLDTLRGKLVSAATYPVILLGVGSLVVLFLLVFVVPEFSKVYEDISTDLPLASQWLLAWGKFVKAHSMSADIAFKVNASAQPGVTSVQVGSVTVLAEDGVPVQVGPPPPAEIQIK